MTDPAVLVLLAHPAFRRSRVNRALAEAIRDLPGVTLHDLLRSDHEQLDLERDAAWDSNTLRREYGRTDPGDGRLETGA
jgi:hypothetical protein